jgi:hypothetical protein
MLNNLTNFFNIIKGRMIRTSATVASTDIIPLGVVNPNYDGGYLPSAITVGDLQTTLSTPSLQQVLDFNHDLVNGLNFQGTGAGAGQSGGNVIGFGNNTCQGNTGQNVIAFGRDCAVENSGNVNIFIGDDAAFQNSGNSNIGLGAVSLLQNSGSKVNAFGTSTGNGNSGSDNNFMGADCGVGNTGDDINAFGVAAARGNTGIHVNAFGRSAGESNQLSGQTIFSDASFPVYANATAAAAVINLANNASANSVYLYYDTALGAVSAVFPV